MIKFAVCDINGAELKPITETEGGGSVTVRLNDRRTGQVTVDFDDPASRQISALDKVIKARLGGELIAAGIVTRPVDQWAARRMVVPFSDPSIKLIAAHIGQRDGQALPGPYPSRPYYLENLDQSYIMSHLVAHAEATGRGERTHGIIDGIFALGVTRTREYEPGKQIWEAVRELSAVQNGADFQLRPLDRVDGVLCALDTFYPRQGTDKTAAGKTAAVELHLGWGDETAADLEHAMDGDLVRNQALVLGGTQPGQTVPALSREVNAPSLAQYGSYAEYISVPDLITTPATQERAIGTVQTYAQPPDVFTVAVAPGRGPVFSPSGAYWIGDTILIVARDEPTGRETVLAGRVIEATLTNQPNGDVTVALTLATQPAGGRTIRPRTTISVIRDTVEGLRAAQLRQ